MEVRQIMGQMSIFGNMTAVGKAQQWELKHIGGDYYALINVLSGKALEVGGSREDNGANVNIWDYDGGKAQQWRRRAVK